jgi:DNA-directed RNA polymerase subunit RPC12/RpoP
MRKEEFRCPGQNTMFWKPGDIYDVSCPNCGKPVEFWKDDARRTCTCGHRFLNPKRDIGCLEWCKYAEKCMPDVFKGENLGAFYRDRLLAAAKKALKPDDKVVEQALEVLDVAEELASAEGGEPKVVLAAAVLSELVQVSPSGRDERAALARNILVELGTEAEVVDEVCKLIHDAFPGTEPGNVNLRILQDARTLIKLGARRALLEKSALERLIDSKVTTQAGRQLARKRLL